MLKVYSINLYTLEILLSNLNGAEDSQIVRIAE
jgi:hypothetical protein